MTSSLKIQDLQALLSRGGALAVEFGPRIDDAESYPEPGMRALALRYLPTSDAEVCRIQFDFGAFDEHNQGLESANYYDKGGVPCLTARQAGSYKPLDEVYFTSSDEMTPWFALLPSPALALYEEFSQTGKPTGTSYLAWLEAQLLQARARVQGEDEPPGAAPSC